MKDEGRGMREKETSGSSLVPRLSSVFPPADDAKLVQLAAHPSGEIFSVMDRADAFTPLVVLLAMLPGLLALQHHPLEDAGALWGLKSLDVLTASSIQDIVDPPTAGPAAALQWSPPLGSWLTAVVMWSLGASRPLSLVLVSAVSTAGVVLVSFFLWRRLGGARLAFWTVLLLAGHRILLSEAADPAPHALACFWGLVTFWGFLTHCEESSGVMSLHLLGAGVALGLCLLAGGSLALVVAATLLVYVIVTVSWPAPSEPERQRRVSGTGWSGASDAVPHTRAAAVSQRETPRAVWPRIGSLLVLMLTAFAVGGWWLLMMLSRYGWDFGWGWLSGAAKEGAATAIPSVGPAVGTWARLASGAADRLLTMLGILWVFPLFGLWRAVRERFTVADPKRRRLLQCLLAWTGCAVLGWLVELKPSGGNGLLPTTLQSFLLLPCLALTAFVVDEVARRRVTVWMSSGLALAALFGTFPLTGPTTLNPAALTGWTALAVVAIGAAVYCLAVLMKDSDARRRFVLRSLIVALIVANAGIGLQASRRSDRDDRALAAFRDELAAVHDAGEWTLIRQGEPSLRLRFLLRSLCPRHEYHVAEDWESAAGVARPGPMRQIIIEWSNREIRPPTAPHSTALVRPVTSPQFFEGRLLRAYLLTPTAE